MANGVTADVIGVDVVANLRTFDTQMRTQEQRADKAARNIGRSMDKAGAAVTGMGVGRGMQGFSRGMRGLATGFGTVGAVAFGAGAANVGIDYYKWAVARLSGDSGKAAEALDKLNASMERLPFGIGMVKRQLDDLVDNIFGNVNQTQIQTKDAAIELAMELQIELNKSKARNDRHRAELDRELAMLRAAAESRSLRAQGVDEEMIKRIFGLREAMADQELKAAMKGKGLTHPFDSFNTPLGTYKSPSFGTAGPLSPEHRRMLDEMKKTADASKDTAKHTKAIAAAMTGSGGMTPFA